MPKRKFHKLKDDASIKEEKARRKERRALRRMPRTEVDEALADYEASKAWR